MAHIERYEVRRGVRYRAHVYVRDQKRLVSRSFRTKAEAKAWAASEETDVHKGTHVSPSTLTVNGLLDLWLDTHLVHRAQESTISDYRYAINKNVRPYLGHLLIQKLNPADIERWHSDLITHGLKPRSVEFVHQRLSTALSHAVRLGLASRNVCSLVPPPPVPKRDLVTYTEEETRRFLAAAAEVSRHGPLWLLVATCGLRRGEVLGLRWRDIDLGRGRLQITQTIGLLEGHATIKARTKTEKGRRIIPLVPAIVAALRSHKTHQAEGRLRLSDLWTDHDLVFPNQTGAPFYPGNLDRDYDRVIAHAGLRRIRIHDQRHTFATTMIARGANIAALSALLGHEHQSTTTDIYGHLVAEMQEQVMDHAAEAWFTEAKKPS